MLVLPVDLTAGKRAQGQLSAFDVTMLVVVAAAGAVDVRKGRCRPVHCSHAC